MFRGSYDHVRLDAELTERDLLLQTLKMAERHIERAREHIEQQEELISALAARGANTEIAIALLDTFVSTLRSHEDHRDRLLRDLDQ